MVLILKDLCIRAALYIVLSLSLSLTLAQTVPSEIRHDRQANTNNPSPIAFGCCVRGCVQNIYVPRTRVGAKSHQHTTDGGARPSAQPADAAPNQMCAYICTVESRTTPLGIVCECVWQARPSTVSDHYQHQRLRARARARPNRPMHAGI